MYLVKTLNWPGVYTGALVILCLAFLMPYCAFIPKVLILSTLKPPLFNSNQISATVLKTKATNIHSTSCHPDSWFLIPDDDDDDDDHHHHHHHHDDDDDDAGELSGSDHHSRREQRWVRGGQANLEKQTWAIEYIWIFLGFQVWKIKKNQKEILKKSDLFAIVFGFLWISLTHYPIIVPLRGSHGLSSRRTLSSWPKGLLPRSRAPEGPKDF